MAFFGALSGLWEHTLGITAAVATLALGACVIEKHFALTPPPQLAPAI